MEAAHERYIDCARALATFPAMFGPHNGAKVEIDPINTELSRFNYRSNLTRV